jgi:dual specificity tyrosine-phosphorylation-regulated kinase 2/3/4
MEHKDPPPEDDDGRSHSVLPAWVKFPSSADEFYPAEFDKVVYDCYNLRVVFDREKTGFEETKDFPIVINSIVAGRYQVVDYLGSAAFSKAIQCYDIHTEQMVCMKIIENNKDYFDQSVDEIKLLRFIAANCEDLDSKNLLKVIDHFYHKEHLFIVTELLRDNLYEYSKYSREVEKKTYFTVPRLQKITKQILNALNFIHDMSLIHCDLKPENILIKSYSKSEVKVIDFGSSCFIHDHLSSYVQSRSYRAPEVILGCKYDYKIDIWSLGCILAELFTGYVLFQNDSVQGLLARVIGIVGPIPEYMMKEGKLVSNFFTREGLIYMEAPDDDEESQSGVPPSQRRRKPRNDDEELKVHILVAKKTNLQKQISTDFIWWLLEVDPAK